MPPHVETEQNQLRWQFLRNQTFDRLPTYRSGTIALYFPTPNRMIRISLGIATELKGIDREHLARIYDRALTKVRDFSEDVTPEKSRQLVETLPTSILVEGFDWIDDA